jgi:hypothetical protein
MMAFLRTVKREARGVSIASDFGELSRAVASFAQESRATNDASRTTSEK